MFSYNKPVVHGITPLSIPTSGGSRLTIRGENFGALPFSLMDPLESKDVEVWLYGKVKDKCQNVAQLSDDLIECTRPALPLGSYSVFVKVGAGKHQQVITSARYRLFSRKKKKGVCNNGRHL